MRSSRTRKYAIRRENILSKRIAEAIRGKTCAICLGHIDARRASVVAVCMHAFCTDCIRRWSNLKRKCPLCNSEFDSWFSNINVASRTFHEERLPALDEAETVKNGEIFSRGGGDRMAEQRVIRRARGELNSVSSRTRPYPTRRSFRWSGSLLLDVVAERILQWRTSIYERHLQAVPFSSRNSLCQHIAGRDDVKEGILQRIEPWIRRELQALLGDPDPSIIVHVAASVFVSRLDEEHTLPSGQIGGENNFLAPLEPFLHERTNMFWHELRCFAESPFSMETYDTVVEYRLIRSGSEEQVVGN